ncbi:glutathione S-transferase family protein [Neptunomonas phycophila]|uniref:glutathione S-transferase family protein n=1 Tax=Neptunomonas phycophila TaxID=1572645 RepID=UPI0009491CFF|nr:glutathione S-transferase family protein [Neptunomonas phycophila]
MGLLVNGQWKDQWYDTDSTNGKFVRDDSRFRHWLTPNGEAGPDGQQGFKAEAGRYHLYVSLACPWAHRTLIARHLKGLEKLITVDVVHPLMLDNGWTLASNFTGATGDSLYQHDFLHQVYTRAKSDYSGRVTVPVLWDKKTHTIVSNESADIIRMFNDAFNEYGATEGDYYPKNKREEIDQLNNWIYDHINNGVYKAGFATTQDAYNEAVMPLFAALDKADKVLSYQRFLTGSDMTEADIRLFTTLIRFDEVYHEHFKCNIRRIADYTHLFGYMKDIYQTQNIANTVNFNHIKTHYYASHKTINPTGIIPSGPQYNLDTPHGRDA